MNYTYDSYGERKYSRTVWPPEEIATWDDPEPEAAQPTLSLVVNNGITPGIG